MDFSELNSSTNNLDMINVKDNELFLAPLLKWYAQYQQTNLNPVFINKTFDLHPAPNLLSHIDLESLTHSIVSSTTASIATSTINTLYSTTTHVITDNLLNCTFEEKQIYVDATNSLKPIIFGLNKLNYFIIIVGILFNLLNLIVLLNSKLNESPYSYLTILAISDLGALLMVGAEKVRQLIIELAPARQADFIRSLHLFVIAPLINIFLSCSMYITLALTIERFIFVHSPFKAITFCRKSIARRVCLAIFIFSILRSLYLPFMYEKNCYDGYSQKKIKLLDIYEFLISLAIPYCIIFITNISLIRSLKKQNSLMNLPVQLTKNDYSFSLPNTRSEHANLPNTSSSFKLAGDDKTGASSSSAKNNKKTIKHSNSVNLGEILSEKKLSQLSFRLNKSKKKQLKDSNLSMNVSQTSLSSNGKICRTNSANMSNPYVSKPKLNGGSYKTTLLYHRTSSVRELRNQRKLTTTLIIILCLLLVSYLPSFFFEESLADFIFGSHENPTNANSIRAFKIKLIGNHASIVLIYLNCSCNFLIYCFCNKKFKNSLKVLIKKSVINKFYQRANYYLSTRCCFSYKKRNNIARHNSHRGANNSNNNNNNTNTNANHHNQVSLLKKIDEDINFIDENNSPNNSVNNGELKVIDFKINDVNEQRSMDEPSRAMKFMERLKRKQNFIKGG